ncbi:LPXTG-motif cell wall anchor domain protein [Streptococcus pneumoniae GA49447]|nr:LPXTG-motif cell wall anchor domain protein [Streptococcus pneumoniae GA49447]EHZ31422.1 LPXTG-motif cell wall anchor domain protein [Streptococcus pneumoniae GA17719]
MPKTGTASGAQTLLAAGIMFIVGIFLGLKKKIKIKTKAIEKNGLCTEIR